MSKSRRLVPPDFGRFTTSNGTGESACNCSTIEPNDRLSPDAMLNDASGVRGRQPDDRRRHVVQVDVVADVVALAEHG